MNKIVEHNNGDNNRNIQVGDSSSAVSIKVYQDLYHQITGRTEQIRKRYSENVLLEFQDIEQLHYKVMQLCDVYHVVAKNETVSVFHDKERKEQFTSFERFRIYNSNATSPCINVVLKYNFSIIPAGIHKAQEYIVTIRLTSRAAALKQAEEDAPAFIRGSMVTFLSENIAEITVEYADYIVARGFVEAFDEWVRGCKCTPKIKSLQFLRRWSHMITDGIRLCLVLIICWFSLKAIPIVLESGSTPSTWGRLLVLYFTSSFVLITLGSIAGSIISAAIDTYPTLSYLKLNKGDERLISEYKIRQNWVIAKFVGGSLFTIALSIFASRLEKLI